MENQDNNLNTQPTETVMEIKSRRRIWRIVLWSLALALVIFISLVNRDIAAGSGISLTQIAGVVSNFGQSVVSTAHEALLNMFGGGNSGEVVQTVDVNNNIGYASVATSLLRDKTTEEEISEQSTETSKTATTNKTKTTTIKSDEAETILNNEQNKVAKLAEENKKTESPVVISKSCGFVTSQSPSHSDVILNEIAWMGGSSNFGLTSTDEWIELKNISGGEIDVNNWQLIDKTEQIKINFGLINRTRLKTGEFVLLERTDDNPVPNIVADLIYTNTLNNTDESLRLYDSQCNLIDEVLAGPDWPAGDNVEKRTMERSSDLSWHTYNGTVQNNIFGTPKKENSTPAVVVSSNGSSSGTPANNQQTTNPSTSLGASNQQQTNSISSPSKILINEIQLASSNSVYDEFVELYNPNNTSVDLTNWYIQKKTQNGSSYSTFAKADLFSGKIISANGYLLIANASSSFSADIFVSSYSIADNNTLILKNLSGDIIDKVGWGTANDCDGNCALNPADGQSIQRINFIDTNNNANDFEIQACPSSKTQSKTCQPAQTNQAPSAFFVYSSQNPRVGDLITFNAASSTDSDGQIISYQWDFGDPSAGSGQTVSTTSTTTAHVYSQAGNYSVSLIVFDDQNASSTATSTAISVVPAGINHVVISEILTGTTASSSDEFIELHNPTNSPISLDGWYIKRKATPTSEEQNLISKTSSVFDTKTIPARGFLLIASNQYLGDKTPDVRYSQNSVFLADNGDVILLYANNDTIVDEVSYNEIERGKSLERKVFSNSQCISAQGDSEFLGNSCDTDSVANDFEIRVTPNPQNSLSLSEPREV